MSWTDFFTLMTGLFFVGAFLFFTMLVMGI